MRFVPISEGQIECAIRGAGSGETTLIKTSPAEAIPMKITLASIDINARPTFKTTKYTKRPSGYTKKIESPQPLLTGGVRQQMLSV